MARTALAGAIALGTWLAAGAAPAAITEIRIDAVEPFANGQGFGEAGSYVRVKGIAKGELDPTTPENAVIVNLDKAPRNSRGLVEYEIDIYILRPADLGRSNRVLLYEVTNRGRKLLLPYVHDASRITPAVANDPKTAEDLGNGFALQRGYTLVWSGWDPDAPKSNNGMSARIPVATDNGRPIVRRIRQEIQVGTRGPADVAVARLVYPAASTDKANARLTVRTREGERRIELSPEQWEFADARSIRLLPEGTKFAPIDIYELWYEATEPKILGIGYAATRDLIAFLRYERADSRGRLNPLLPTGSEAGIRHALALGISQSGRYLRHHLELGMNRDEHGRRVFDGVLSHIAGAGKVFANHEFAMPGRTATQHEDRFYPENWFPFSQAATIDPFSGRTAGLTRGDSSDPLVIETNTSTEYWQKGASLIHTDPKGQRDVGTASARAYLIAGTQHGGRAGTSSSPGACANPRNPHSSGPALRALIVALEEWVAQGVLPPASRVPSISAGTAVDAATLKLPPVRNFAIAPGANPIGPPVDWIDLPGSSPGTFLVASAPDFYGTRVSAVDSDGNEVAGIRLPPIAAPLGTYTGWNVYKAAPSELCDRDGSYIPFARTKAEREAAGDPRPSLEERYGSRASYVERVRTEANALMRERLLLPADATAYVRAAEASDRF
jgi:hypothetical protein